MKGKNFIMKKQFIISSGFILLLLNVFLVNAFSQGNMDKNPASKADINQIRQSIEKNPSDLDLHDKYLKATEFTKWGVSEDPAFIQQYQDWMKEFSKVAAIPYALGHAYTGIESPKAKPYLEKALTIDPNYDKAYFDLWIDAERWGDFNVSREYIHKAAELKPDNADYAFYYANSFENDQDKYSKASLDVARLFPQTERGAQALYWLANRTKDPSLKFKYYEQQKKDFPADKYNWTSSGMSDYFSLLLEKSPADAAKLATEMSNMPFEENSLKTWKANIELADNISTVQNLLANHKSKEAVEIMHKVKVPRWGTAKEFITLLKSKAFNAAGDAKAAYDNLLQVFAKEPTEEINNSLYSYGKALGKTAEQVNKEVWYIRDTTSKQAPVFNLETYLTKGRSSLNDYKGKVVLLTYWFPGCGPCRGEFPHFENVVKHFKGKDFVYLGINISAEQDEYVIPFMRSSGYSFIPLKDNADWKKGPLDNRNAAPMNFLIDENGKIIFSNFRIDGSNESSLEMMIQSMLQRKKAA